MPNKILNEEKIIKLIQNTLGKKVKITLKSNMNNVENWDSLTHVQLVTALEKKFKIKVSPEEGIDAFNNFKELTSFVQKKISKKR